MACTAAKVVTVAHNTASRPTLRRLIQIPASASAHTGMYDAV